ncbi:hypothetical protein [Herbaspirillum sp. SJZ107]|uniref:hypothetical protein n=1 Tax=Herbaspirillum sp. SJZ107 TaxID=2572881 RepID=UPI00114DBAEC|nr:hypothetical protein [Herbaspirillum sp. SJZ107]
MTTFTRIGDLIAALQECDPDGTITITLDGALVFDDEVPDEVEYRSDPVVDFLFSKSDAVKSDRVHLGLSKMDTEEIVSDRRNQLNTHLKESSLSTNPGVVMNAPVAIALAFDHDTYVNLQAVVANCNLSEGSRDGATTHGKLDVPRLLAMLAEDAAMTNTRPSSWEGANMQQVLDSHGYV